jgi:GrpB-like predicted nucleotidyltransferase (UPF0157 family)
MNPEDIVHFLPSEELFQKSQSVFNLQKEELENILPQVDIQQVGSCAIPGAIGKFDVDVQIRVRPDQFKEVVGILHQHYEPKHPEIWTDEFVAFSNNKEYLIDLVVTVIDSNKDDFYRVRDALIANPELLEEYNTLKRSFEGKPYAEYSKAKKEFLGGNGKVRFLTY